MLTGSVTLELPVKWIVERGNAPAGLNAEGSERQCASAPVRQWRVVGDQELLLLDAVDIDDARGQKGRLADQRIDALLGEVRDIRGGREAFVDLRVASRRGVQRQRVFEHDERHDARLFAVHTHDVLGGERPTGPSRHSAGPSSERGALSAD